MLLLPPSTVVSIIVHFSVIAITITPSPELDKFRGIDSEHVCMLFCFIFTDGLLDSNFYASINLMTNKQGKKYKGLELIF